jgi:serine protease Do
MTSQTGKDTFWKVFSALLLVVLIGVVAYTVWLQQQPRHVYYQRTPSQPVSDLAALAPGLTVDHDSIYWVADLAEQALPFVVNVETVFEVPEHQEGDAQDFMDEMQRSLPRFFREFEMPEMPEMPDGHPPLGGEGSGFFVREDGYVVTNAHVVQEASEFIVHTNDGESYPAELIGADNFKDIAVLKIDTDHELPVAVLGDSDATRIGEPVIAIGSPLGYEATVTAGIVSTNKRSLEDLGRPSDIRRPQSMIQTDAAINQGNSGGPLLNAEGEVIGVNQAIMRYENGSGMMGFGRQVPVEGIGFAIPINDVKNSIEQIVQRGKVVYPGISAVIQPLKTYIEREPDLDLEDLAVEDGVFVVRVTVGGPADRAGIEAGDVILSIDNLEVASGDDLISVIQDRQVGDRVKLLVARQGGERQEEVTVVLGELDLSEIQVE